MRLRIRVALAHYPLKILGFKPQSRHLLYLHICIVGGIFDKPAAYRSQHAISPETVLADGLRARGCDVTTCGHSTLPTRDDFDLIHVHHFGRAALRLASKADRPPFVLTTHDPFAMNGLSVGWRRRLTDGFVLKKIDALVALSLAERNFWMRKGVPPARLTVIPNGIDPGIFERHEPETHGHGDLLLFVGQLQRFKGLDYLLAAMPSVRAAYPTAKLQVVHQTGALLGRYQAQAAALALDGTIEFAGPRTAAELAHLYSAADVVVSPSLGECLSTVVLEAMCCGAAVVATDVGGIREQLDETTGVIVPPRDPAALARAICGLLADSRRRRSLGQAARRKVHARFSLHSMIDCHVRLYEELLHSDERAA